MEDMLALPPDRPTPRPWRLVVLMAMTALLYMVVVGGVHHPVDQRPVMTASISTQG